MRIKNARPYPLTIASTGQRVQPGETVEVDAELGRSLCEQPANWAAAPSESRTKAAAPSESRTKKGPQP